MREENRSDYIKGIRVRELVSGKGDRKEGRRLASIWGEVCGDVGEGKRIHWW